MTDPFLLIQLAFIGVQLWCINTSILRLARAVENWRGR